MAIKKISELPEASAVDAGDQVVLNQGGVTKRAAVSLLGVTGGGGGTAEDRSAVTALTIASGIVDVDVDAGDYFTLALSANVTGWTFSGLPGEGRGASVLILVTQDGSGGRALALPATWKLTAGSSAAIGSAAGAKTLVALSTFDNGASWVATLTAVAA